MTIITEEGGHVTQITTLETDPARQDELLAILKERARFMAMQEGFVSISLHRSLDGRKIVNYVQWTTQDLLEQAHQAPEFRDRWPEVSELTQSTASVFYEVVHAASK